VLQYFIHLLSKSFICLTGFLILLINSISLGEGYELLHRGLDFKKTGMGIDWASIFFFLLFNIKIFFLRGRNF